MLPYTSIKGNIEHTKRKEVETRISVHWELNRTRNRLMNRKLRTQNRLLVLILAAFNWIIDCIYIYSWMVLFSRNTHTSSAQTCTLKRNEQNENLKSANRSRFRSGIPFRMACFFLRYAFIFHWHEQTLWINLNLICSEKATIIMYGEFVCN